MREKGMINVRVIETMRANFATAAAALILEMEDFIPAVWPPHRYQEIVQEDGAFIEGSVDRSAPHFPGREVTVPDWSDRGAAYSFGITEGNRVTNFQDWLFSRRSANFLSDYFSGGALELTDVFSRFESRGDRQFEGEKFPRDEWKAGSFDVERFFSRRVAIGNAASVVMMEIDRINSENVVLSPREWIQTKFVAGPLVGGGGTDVTFANVPEVLADIDGWLDLPAYGRVSDLVHDTDPTWTAAGMSFARAANSYGLQFSRLRAIQDDFLNECVTLWRTGSQTRRRGP